MITKRTKAIGLISILFFVVTCIALFSAWKYVEIKGDKMLQQSKEIADYQAREQTYSELGQLIKSTQNDREELVSYILTEDRTVGFLATIEKIAVEQGIELVTDSLKVLEQPGLFNTLSISFSVQGSKERVYSMLHIFETLPYHAFVSGVSFRKDTETAIAEVVGTIELTVSLLTYD